MVASQRVRARRGLNSRLARGAGAQREGRRECHEAGSRTHFSGLAERDRFAEVAVGKALSRGRCDRVGGTAVP